MGTPIRDNPRPARPGNRVSQGSAACPVFLKVQSELVEHVSDMDLHGALGEEELCRDLVIAHVIGNQARDLQLPSIRLIACDDSHHH